jgi:hypothetical protein
MAGRIPAPKGGQMTGEMWTRFRIAIHPAGEGTHVEVTCSVFGWGSYMGRKMERDANTVCNAIQVAAANSHLLGMGDSNCSFADALESLARLQAQRMLTDDEFQKAKARVLEG